MKKAVTFVAAALVTASFVNPLTAYAAGTIQGKVIYRGSIGNIQEAGDGSVNWESFGNGLVGGVVIWKDGCAVLPDFPGNSQQPENDGGAGQPGNEDTPNQPDSDGTPSTPSQPDNDSTPNQPDSDGTPGTPNQPGNDSKPNQPDNDGTPGTPSQPDNDSTPNQPGNDGTPGNPGTPNQPDSDGTPDNPDAPQEPGTSTEGKSYAWQVVELVNAERAKEGLAPLTIDEKIADAAAIRAREIPRNFSHTRPDGTSFSTALKEAGAVYRRAGENIAWGQKTPAEVVKAWMNSTGHRANIMSKNYSRIGVAYYQEGGKAYWVQLFAD